MRPHRLFLAFLVPKFHLGTQLLRQFHCRSRCHNTKWDQREMQFRGNKRRSQMKFGNEAFSRRGSALILVLWGLLLLGMAVFGVVDMVELSVEHTSHEELALDARGLALSGVALGLNPQLLKDDPLLFQKPAAGRQFKVAIESEGARLNLNYVLLSGHREILENLFTQWGLKVDQAEHVADCLFDW